LPGFSKSDGRAASISDGAIPNFSRATWQKQAGGLAAAKIRERTREFVGPWTKKAGEFNPRILFRWILSKLFLKPDHCLSTTIYHFFRSALLARLNLNNAQTESSAAPRLTR
jgi:hypothetical protein